METRSDDKVPSTKCMWKFCVSFPFDSNPKPSETGLGICIALFLRCFQLAKIMVAPNSEKFAQDATQLFLQLWSSYPLSILISWNPKRANRTQFLCILIICDTMYTYNLWSFSNDVRMKNLSVIKALNLVFTVAYFLRIYYIKH